MGGARVVVLEGGYSNESLRVDARDGRFVVRRYGRLHVTRAAIAFEHAVVAHAAEQLREVVAPLRDSGGRTIVTPPGGGSAAVFPYIEGVAGRRDLATACAAARVLARFHRAVRDVAPSTSSGQAFAGGMRSARFVGMFAWLRERFTRFAADPLVARKLDWDALVAATTAATARVAPRANALPHVVVHGDPNPGNVVSVQAGEVSGLIDFDFTHETERVYDVGALLDEFARENDDGPLILGRVAPLLAAYAQEAPLAPEERELVPEAMLRRVATLAWYVVARHGERVPGDVGGAPRYAARAAEIVAHAGAIREAARG